MQINKKILPFIYLFYTNIYARSNALNSLGIIESIIKKVCLISGAAVLFCAIMRYFAHRKNPVAIKFSQPFWLLIIGLLLIGLAYLPSPIN